MTNPRIERDPREKVRPDEVLASQKLGISRHPRARPAPVLEERVRVVNHAEAPVEVELELELAADAADIFEVRGWVRPERGRHLPIAHARRPGDVPLRRPGRDAARDPPRVLGAVGATPGRSTPRWRAPANAGWVRLHWHWEPAAGRGARAHAGSTGPRRATAPVQRADRDGSSRTRCCSRQRRGSTPTRSPRRTTAGSRGFAEIRTDNELFNLAIDRSAGDLRLLINDGPGAGRAVPRRRRPVVHDAVRARLDHRLVPGARGPAAARGRDPRGAGARSRRPSEDPSRDAEPGKIPARAADRRDGPRGRAAAPAVLRHRRRDAAVARAARRDVGLDRRPGPRRPAVAERAPRARVDRPLRRPRRRRVRGVRAPDAGRAAQPGLEGLARRDPRPARAARRRPRSPSPRSRATCSTPSAGWRSSPGSAARASSRPASTREAEQLRARFEEAFWSEDQGFYAHGPRRREAPGRRDRLQRRPLPVERDRVAGAGRGRSSSG